MQFDLIVAFDSKFGISREGLLPWKDTNAGRADMKRFVKLTRKPGCAVIMGRKTWDSIGKALPGRINVIVSSQTIGTRTFGLLTETPIINVNNFEQALQWCNENSHRGLNIVENCMVIGGANIYRQALDHPLLSRGYLTQFHHDFECDLMLPKQIMVGTVVEHEMLGDASTYTIDYSNRCEQNYLHLLRRLLEAPTRPNRTAVSCRGLFHETLKFKLTDERGPVLPLLTTKRVPWHLVYAETMWFLSGRCVNTDYLHEKSVHVWDGNSSREYLDGRGLVHYRTGELGPQYGWQWRRWNATYVPECDRNTTEFAAGIDQLVQVIENLKTDPWSRRHLVTAWNPEQLSQMALPACHYSFQFHVEGTAGIPERLNCLVNMRSGDSFLGIPFNTISYSLITHIVAKIVGLQPGTLSFSIADCHIYENQIDAIKTQIAREPRRFPTFHFGGNLDKKENVTLDDFLNADFTDYVVSDYMPHPTIKCPMVA